jgi:hypothetical protein
MTSSPQKTLAYEDLFEHHCNFCNATGLISVRMLKHQRVKKTVRLACLG